MRELPPEDARARAPHAGRPAAAAKAGALTAGYAVAVTKDRLLYRDPAASLLGIDEGTMSVPAVISTEAEDRDGDIVIASGVRLDEYRGNPVVLWSHGQSAAIPFPIGKSQSPDGALQIFPEAGRVTARCFFAQKGRWAETAADIFQLCVDGVVNTTSIGFNPRKATPRSRRGNRYDEWTLLEWSFCALPVNPQCQILRGYLSRGRIAGKRIDPVLVKSLEPLAAPLGVWANGATLNANEEPAMSKKWKKAAPKPATQTAAEATETKAAPPPPAQGQQPEAAPQPAPAPAAPAQTDLPTLLGQLTALIGQLTTIAQPAAPPAADAGMPPEGAAEQATDEDGDQGFGDESEEDAEEDAANSGDGESYGDDQEDDAEDEEETEELLQRYRAGEPAVAKDMTEADGQAGGYVTDSMPEDHRAVCRAVADHLDEMAGCEPGSTFTHSHKAAFAHHAKCMKAVCRAMDAAEGGETGEPADSADVTEKAADLFDGAAILDALRPLAVRVTGYEDLLYSITGKRAA
jgi:hypothetical protein